MTYMARVTRVGAPITDQMIWTPGGTHMKWIN